MPDIQWLGKTLQVLHKLSKNAYKCQFIELNFRHASNYLVIQRFCRNSIFLSTLSDDILKKYSQRPFLRHPSLLIRLWMFLPLDHLNLDKLSSKIESHIFLICNGLNLILQSQFESENQFQLPLYYYKNNLTIFTNIIEKLVRRKFFFFLTENHPFC